MFTGWISQHYFLARVFTIIVIRIIILDFPNRTSREVAQYLVRFLRIRLGDKELKNKKHYTSPNSHARLIAKKKTSCWPIPGKKCVPEAQTRLFSIWFFCRNKFLPRLRRFSQRFFVPSTEDIFLGKYGCNHKICHNNN